MGDQVQSGILVLRTRMGLSKPMFMHEVTKISSMVSMLSKLGFYPEIDKMVIGDNKLYVYFQR